MAENKVIVRYGREGTAFPDHLCEKWLLDAARAEEPVLIFSSTENMVYAARVLRAEGKLPNLSFEYVWECGEVGEELEIDEDGRLPYWPKGFADHVDGWLLRLLDERLGDENGRSTNC